MNGNDKTLQVETLTIERKQFELRLMKNSRGKFLRITESAGNRRSMIVIPETGLGEFVAALHKI